jgi:UDP-N-acetyl-L-fucosamine synthase
MMRIMTVVGTRPEIIRLSRVIPALDRAFEHIFVHTGQNYDYELNEIFFQDLEVRKPDHFLNAAGSTSAETIGNIIIEFDKLLAEFKPSALLILGDTNSCLAAIPAKKRQIPIFHMEAGNRCFDQRVPEETNRKIVDHIADINLTYSDIARSYLLREGLSPDRVIKTGSPMFEVIEFYKNKIDRSKSVEFLDLVKHKYFVVSAHREENIESETNFTKFINCLNAVADEYQLPIIVSTHPRTRIKLDTYKKPIHGLIQFMKPLGFTDYVSLQINAKAVLSDSGTITEESSILNFPALNLREAHERPEGMEEASVMMVGLDSSTVLCGLRILEQQARGSNRELNIVRDYSYNNVSQKIVRIILSYIGYVDRVVWAKKSLN